MYESTSAYLFPKESNTCVSFAYDSFLSQLKLLSTRLFGVLCGKGVTTHTIRNLGYVLAIWSDGEMLEAIDDATHWYLLNITGMYLLLLSMLRHQWLLTFLHHPKWLKRSLWV